MAVQVINFPIEQGTDFSLSLTLKSNGAPIDLTNYSFSAKMRKYYITAILVEAIKELKVEIEELKSKIPA